MPLNFVRKTFNSGSYRNSTQEERTAKSCRVYIDSSGIHVECDDGTRAKIDPAMIRAGCVLYIDDDGTPRLVCDRNIRKVLAQFR